MNLKGSLLGSQGMKEKRSFVCRIELAKPLMVTLEPPEKTQAVAKVLHSYVEAESLNQNHL